MSDVESRSTVADAAMREAGSDRKGAIKRLVLAAREEFAAYGFEGGRVDRIARIAKANKQLIYYYFKTKDGLYQAVIEDAYHRILGDQSELLTKLDALEPIAAIEELAGYLFREEDTYRVSERILLDANLRGMITVVSEAVRQSYAELIACVDRILARGVQVGVFRNGLIAKEVYISLVSSGSLRLTNAASISGILDIDLTSKHGQRSSQQYGLALIINGLKPQIPI